MKDELAEGDEPSASSALSPREPTFEVPPLSQDNVFDALASKRSRYVLVTLRDAEGPVGVRELVDTVAAWETNKPIDLVSEEHCKRVFTSLCHSQLPKLAMMGLVEYDEDDEVVKRGPYAEQADAYLDIAASRDENVEV
ncbi:DUF7344 domain-containing protein [Halorussus pelagicus]|uniref:DUF7344 domain-containing protein n=1 Tax=Halorussus pelagicus TaxID=2505977 RepID=UPI000FFB96EB|nr:hypothetical protein [Halorussus pelagicus]